MSAEREHRSEPSMSTTSTGESHAKGKDKKTFRHRSAGRASSIVMLAGFLAGSGLLVALGLRFPAEASRWMENQDEIRKLQDQNADLRKRREERLERLKTFRESFQDQELEIRRQYNLYKPGDTVFMLPPSEPDTSITGQKAGSGSTNR
jgi:cell division protein FtsB